MRRLDSECKGGWVLCLGGCGPSLEGVNRDFHGSRKVPGAAYRTERNREAMRVLKIATVGGGKEDIYDWTHVQLLLICAHVHTHMGVRATVEGVSCARSIVLEGCFGRANCAG